MANSDKNIIIRPRTGDSTNNPVLEFVGASSGLGPQTITFEAKPDNQGTVEVKGTSGTIITISDNATYPVIFAKDTQFSGTVSFAGALSLDGNVTLGNAASDTLTINSTIQGGTPLIFEGATSNTFQTSIAITDPTADRTITLPDASGTVAVSVSDTTTTTQGALNLDFTLSAAGNISATGSSYGLATTDSPTFTGATLDNIRIGITSVNEIDTSSGNLTLDSTGGTVVVDDNLEVTGNLLVNRIESRTSNSNITLAPDGTGNVLVTSDLTIKSTLRFEGATANDFETDFVCADPTADRTITLPDNSGTVAVAGTSTAVQSELDIAISATGVISGSAEGLATTDTPTFAGLTINGSTITFEGSSADDFEITLTVTNPTADRTITLPNNTGTVAVAGTSTTVQSELDIAISATGVISGSAEGLATTDTPTFAGLTINGSSIIFEGSSADDFETTLTVTNPTADRIITLPNNTGTIAVAGTSTAVQSELDIAISATGVISGSAEGLATTDTPTFAGLTTTGAITVGTDLVPDTDNTGNVGTSALTFAGGWFTNLTVDSTLDVRGAIDLQDSDILRFGTGDDWEFFHDGTNNYIDLNLGDMIVRDGTTTRFTFGRTTGDLVPGTDNTGNVGTSALTFAGGWFTNLTVDSTLDVRGAIDLADSDILRFGTSDDWEFFHDGTNNYVDLNVGNMIVRDGTTTRFTFERTTGNFTATGDVTAFSDARLKTNVITYPDALNTVSKMRGVSYEKDGRKGVGVIAQEIEEILPEVVNNAGEYKSVAYGNIVGVLIEAIKELKAEIEELKKSKN